MLITNVQYLYEIAGIAHAFPAFFISQVATPDYRTLLSLLFSEIAR